MTFAEFLRQDEEIRGVKNFQMGAKPEAPSYTNQLRRYSPFKAQNPSRLVSYKPIFRKPGNTSAHAPSTVAGKNS